MTRRATIAATLVLIATAALFVGPASITLTTGARLQMVVWGMPFEDHLFRDRWARRWESLHPEVHVDYLRYSDVRAKYNAWHARRRGPEIMRLEITWYHEFVRRGMLLPLDERIADPALGLPLDAFPPEILDQLRIDGRLYALPQDNAAYGLYFNKDLFDAHNAAHPDTPIPYPDESWTWNDLRRAASQLTRRDADGNTLQSGFDCALWAWPFLALLAQAGGQCWSDDGSRCVINSDAGVEALEFLRALQLDGSFDPQLGSYREGLGADTLFGQGKTAMLLDGSWRAPNLDLSYPGLRYAIAPLPRGRRNAVVCGSVLWGISAHAEHPDEAFDFLRWLVADEQAAEYWDALRVAPPANLRVLNAESFTAAAGIPRDANDPAQGWDVPPMPRADFQDKAAWLRAVHQPDESGHVPAFVPAHPFQADLNDQITQALVRYLRPGARDDARDVLRDAADNVHAIIRRSTTRSNQEHTK